MPQFHINLIFIVVLFSVVCGYSTDRYSGSFRHIRRIIEENALEPVSEDTLFEGAITGMMGTMDRFSSYLPPQGYQELNESISQEFGGIGVSFSVSEETHKPTINVVFPATPAARTGVQVDDILVSVDGVPIDKKNLNDLASLLRGVVGTSVMLGVERPAEKKVLNFSLV